MAHTPVPPGPLTPGTTIEIPLSMTVVGDHGDEVEMSGAWNFPNPTIFVRLVPRNIIDGGWVVS